MAILKKNKKKNLQNKTKKFVRNHKSEITLWGVVTGGAIASGINAYVTHKKIKEMEEDINANAECINELNKCCNVVGTWIENHDLEEDDDDYEDEEDGYDELSESLAAAVTEAIVNSGVEIPDEIIPDIDQENE